MEMKVFLSCLAVIALCLSPINSFATSKHSKKTAMVKDVGPLVTLNDCFKAALKRSETLATQQELIFQAEEEYNRAWGSILPTVDATYSYLNKSASKGVRTAKVTASQPLFRGFRDFAALDVTKTLITSQQQAREWAGMQLYRDVAAGFYTLLAAQKDLFVLDKELALYKKRIKELQDRVIIGRSRNTEVLTIQSAQAILKAQRGQVLAQLAVAKEVLAFLTGWDHSLRLEDVNAIPANIESLNDYQLRIPARPDVLAARKNVEASLSNITIAEGAHLPSVDAIGNYYSQERNNWDAQISVTLPIFSGGIISSNVRTAESQKRQNEFMLSQVERLAKEDIRSLHHNFIYTKDQVTVFEEALRLAAENYKANLKDYEFGLVTNLDVLQALTAYQETERSLEKTKYSAMIYYHQLEAAAANRLTLMRNWE